MNKLNVAVVGGVITGVVGGLIAGSWLGQQLLPQPPPVEYNLPFGDTSPDYDEIDDMMLTALAVERNYGSVVIEEIASVYDGDTFKINVEEWPDIVGDEISIRVNGIDTPERVGTSDDIKELAEAARQITSTLLYNAEVIELRNIQRGKYFRIIADVYVDDRSLADALMEQGLAKPYDGGTRPQWTQEDYDGYFQTTN
jgi:micrococcal nuclease